MVGHVRDPVGDLPADRAAALAHDRRPPRARAASGHPLRVPATIQAGVRAAVPGRRARAARRRSSEHLFGGQSALYWMLVVGVLAYAGSYFARGWLAGHQRFGLYGGLVLLESTSRFLFALGGGGRDHRRPDGDRARHGGRAVRLARRRAVRVRRVAQHVRAPAAAEREAPVLDAAGEGPAHAEIEEAAADLSIRRGARFAVAVFGIMLAEQTLMNAAVLIVNANSSDGARRLRLQRAADRARAAAAVPGDPDLDPAPPHRPEAPASDEAVRAARCARPCSRSPASRARARSACWRSGRAVMTRVLRRQGLPLRPRRAGARRDRDGLPPDRRHAQPGRARAQPRRPGRRRVAALRARCSSPGCSRRSCSDEVLRVEIGYFGATFLLSGLLFGLYRRPSA